MSDEDPATIVERIRNWLRVPRDTETVLNNANELREWMEKVLLRDHEDTVVTHHVLRNQEAKLAHLTATKPQCGIKPRRKINSPIGEPLLTDPQTVRFADTLALICNFFADFGHLRDAANAAARDADTVRAGWLKLIWRDDPERTATGATIFDDDLIRVFRYKWLRDRFRDKKFTKDDPDYESMTNLETRIRADVIGQYQAMIAEAPDEPVVAEAGDSVVMAMSQNPHSARVEELFNGAEIDDEELRDIPRFLGFDFDVVDLEDIRLDWVITKPEFYHRSRRIAHRTRMPRSEVFNRYEVSDEDKAKLGEADEEKSPVGKSTSDKNTAGVNAELDSAAEDDAYTLYADSLDVWEVWDRDDGAVYVICKDVLLHKYIPRNVGPHWFPFFMLWFHEMSGRLYAPSSVELQQSLQDELNTIRTQARAYRRAVLPRLIIGKGAMSAEEIEKYESGNGLTVMEVERFEDIQKSLQQLNGIPYIPEIVSTNEVFLDMQLTAGMPTSGLGGVGNAKLATEVAFAGEQLQTQMDRTKFLFNAFLTRIFHEMVYIIVRSLPYENAVEIAGEHIVFPLDPVERQNMLADLLIEIDTSPTGKPNAREELEHIQLISAILAQQGMQIQPEFLAARISRALNIETDWHDMIGLVGPLPTDRRAEGGGPGEPPTGAPPGPAPGTPTGGLPGMPTVQQLPGGNVPTM